MSHDQHNARRVSRRSPLSAFAATILLVSTAPPADGQTDPGPRTGVAAAGGPVAGLSTSQLAMFAQGQGTFQEVDNVADGLGPRFNADSCAACHAFPAVGGSSPKNNPQVNFANSRNQLPRFVRANGPVTEARFINKSDGTPDGGVHALFTIAGRPDQPANCNISQENFTNGSNISLRIPTPDLRTRTDRSNTRFRAGEQPRRHHQRQVLPRHSRETEP